MCVWTECGSGWRLWNGPRCCVWVLFQAGVCLSLIKPDGFCCCSLYTLCVWVCTLTWLLWCGSTPVWSREERKESRAGGRVTLALKALLHIIKRHWNSEESFKERASDFDATVHSIYCYPGRERNEGMISRLRFSKQLHNAAAISACQALEKDQRWSCRRERQGNHRSVQTHVSCLFCFASLPEGWRNSWTFWKTKTLVIYSPSCHSKPTLLFFFLLKNPKRRLFACKWMRFEAFKLQNKTKWNQK